MIGQPLLQAVPGEPSDRQIDLRLAHEPPVLDDAEQEQQGRFRDPSVTF
jgi:hypothetical protein